MLGSIALLALPGCPGNLENPDTVIIQGGGSSVAGSNGTAGAFVDMVDLTCITAYFKASCTTVGCHSSGATAAAGLDLASPGFAGRMVDVPATHQLAGGACQPAKLIDSANPAMSWLLIKVNGTQGTCGSQMPLGASTAPATADETCITTFVNAEAAEHSGTSATGTAGAPSAGASSGGSGGASAGSGGM